MKVALVGWDIDHDTIVALAGLGLEVSAFTRWHGGMSRREVGRGWDLRRCPHQIGGGFDAESWSFRQSVLESLDQEPGTLGDGFDVIHSLDPLTRAAAAGLFERAPLAARVSTIGLTDLLGVTACGDADRRVADHPWLFEHWRGPGSPALVPERLAFRTGGDRSSPLTLESGPLLAIWIKKACDVDPLTIAQGLSKARGDVSGLSAVVLGANPAAEGLRRALSRGGLTVRKAYAARDASPSRWNAWIDAATALAVSGPTIADEPAAWAAWACGKPVVALGGNRPADLLAGSFREVLLPNPRRDRQVRAGSALAHEKLGPRGVAHGLLNVYLDARRDAEAAAAVPSTMMRSGLLGRSRLSLVPLNSWEVFASWRANAEDRSTALDWLGADAPRASLTLRFHDITDLMFVGSNAHSVWDVELSPGERHRGLRMPFPGRSLTAALGYRTPRGAFLPLVHAGPIHLPRESPSIVGTDHTLRSLPRR